MRTAIVRIALAALGIMQAAGTAIAAATPSDPAPPPSLNVVTPVPGQSDPDWVHNSKINCWAFAPWKQDGLAFEFTGSCSNNLIEGTGTVTWTAWGTKYGVASGSFRHGKLDGEGSIVFYDGTSFEGTFQNGLLNGSGKKHCSCGDVYEGTFRNGEPDGINKAVFLNAGQYVGNFTNGRENGHGVYTLPGGASFEGAFVNGQSTGTILYRGADGTAFKGAVVQPHADPAFPAPAPVYPESAVRMDEQGIVVVRFIVSKDGHVEDPHVTRSSGYSDLDAAALAAMSSWHMLPGTVDGHPVEFPVTLPVNFKLHV